MIDYEEHANNLWLNYLDSVVLKPEGGQFSAEADTWMKHIVGCYRSWFDWMTDEKVEETGDLGQDFLAQYTRMRAFVATCDLEQERTRYHPDWGTWAWKTSDVIYHALTHGVYHRGHIRSLAEQHGLSAWPDTDWDEFVGHKIAD